MVTSDPGRDDAAVFTLLYVSELTAGGAAEIDQICRQSRANNERDGITGVLVFDGQAFCQFVEGSQAAVSALRDRLERDRRHRDMRVLQFGRTPASLHVVAAGLCVQRRARGDREDREPSRRRGARRLPRLAACAGRKRRPPR